jgi:hypothetical protein
LDDTSTNLANINGVIVPTATFGIRVNKSGVLPSLRQAAVVKEDVTLLELKSKQCEK